MPLLGEPLHLVWDGPPSIAENPLLPLACVHICQEALYSGAMRLFDPIGGGKRPQAAQSSHSTRHAWVC